MDARTLAAAMPGLSLRKAKRLVGPCNAAMRRGNINTPTRAAAFLAQIGHESVSLLYRAEIGGPSTRYAPYYGRTFIQVTWRENYLAFGRWLGVGDLFVRKPWLLERDDYAWLGPVWYWSTRGLNAFADRGDFDGITYRINGGYNGKSDRDARYARCRRLGSRLLPTKPSPVTRGERYLLRLLTAKGISRARRKRAAHALAARRGWLLKMGRRKGWNSKRARRGKWSARQAWIAKALDRFRK